MEVVTGRIGLARVGLEKGIVRHSAAANILVLVVAVAVELQWPAVFRIGIVAAEGLVAAQATVMMEHGSFPAFADYLAALETPAHG